MPEKSFTVNIYQVVVQNDDEQQLRLVDNSFDAAIVAACGSSFNHKNQDIRGKMCRLENEDRQEDYRLLNFATAAFDGPGHFRQTTRVVPFGLQQDESFAHETAMLYDPGQNLVFLESSQRGMNRVTIAHYLMKFALPKTNYELVPVLDNESASRARRYKTIRSLTIGVALPAFTKTDHEEGAGAIQGLGDRYGADSIEMKVQAIRKGKTLSLNRLWETVDFLLGQSGSDSVSDLTIDGREFDEDDFAIIDLIQHREKRTRMLQVDNIERKVPHTERWQALVQIRRGISFIMSARFERYFPFLLAAIVAVGMAVLVFGFGKFPNSSALPAATTTLGVVVAGFTATQRNMLLGMRGSSVLRFLSRTGYYINVLDYLMQCLYSALLVSAISIMGFFVDCNTLLWKIWMVAISFTVTLVLIMIWRNEILMARIIKRFMEDSENSAR